MSGNRIIKTKPVPRKAAATRTSATPAVYNGPPIATVAQADSSGRITEFSSENDRCPICKSDRYINPRLRLLVNKCYHKMCESCIDRLFTLGPEPCPICGVELRKTGFTAQTFEDLGVEKEVAIRKRIAKCFNKRQEDFPDLKAYNDYLEEVEDITFNLINSIDVAATELKIKAYQQANAALIAKNARLDTSEAMRQQKADEKEQADRLQRRRLAQQLETAETVSRQESEQELIRSLGSVADNQEASRLYNKAKRQAAQKRKEAEVIPEEWARLMMAGNARTDDDDVQEESTKDFDFSADRSRWYDYSDMFQLPNVTPGLFNSGYPNDPWSLGTKKEEDLALRASAGGFHKEYFWERAVRSSVQGLFVPLASS